MNWTKEQQRAIDEREKNILVAAAAGSGKTAVLVERIKKIDHRGRRIHRQNVDRYLYQRCRSGDERENPHGDQQRNR